MGFSNIQWQPPGLWQEFEDLCRLLWSEIWNDPHAQKNGRQGQEQHGVDVFGRPGQGKTLAGVQCKGKDDYQNRTLTEEELLAEVEEAKLFEPKLTEFTVATTGHRDSDIQALAGKITEINQAAGLFSVHVFFWEDMKEQIESHPVVAEWYLRRYVMPPGWASGVDAGVASKVTETWQIVQAIQQTMAANIQVPDVQLQSEYKAQLDNIKRLTDAGKPDTAKHLINDLRSRAWGQLESAARYRLTVLEAVTAWQSGDSSKAGTLLVQALEFKPDDDKALVNCAQGHLMLGQTGEALSRAKQALVIDPKNCAAHGVIVQASPDSETFDALVASVPAECHDKPAVACALANTARRRGLLADAVHWLRTALAGDNETSPELMADLGQALLTVATGSESLLQAKASKLAEADLFAEARKLYEEAWNAVKGTELRKYNASWLANLANARWMTDDIEGARDAIGEALQIEPDKAEFIKIKAAVALEGRRADEAIQLLERISSNTATPEAALLLGLVLGEHGRAADAVGVLDRFLAQDPDDNRHRTDAVLLRARFLTESGRGDDGLAAVEHVLAEPAVELRWMVFAARVAEVAGKPSRAQEIMGRAMQMVDGPVPLRDALALAEELARRKQFDSAARVYEKTGAAVPTSPVAANLLQCYYFAGDLGKALALCNSMREKSGIQRRISAMAPAILDEIGDLLGAAKGYAEYLVVFPDDLEPKLYLAHVNLRLGNLDAVDAFLAEPLEADKLSLELGSKLAYLFHERGKYRKTIEILYEMRRKHYDNPRAHQRYWGACIQITRNQGDGWPGDVDTAGVDSAVQVSDGSGGEQWFIVEKRSDPDLAKGEMTPEHPVARALLGKSAGDEVVLGVDVAERTVRVVRVASKYVWAFNDTAEKFQNIFPETQGIRRFHVDTSGNSEKLRKSLRPVLDQVRAHNQSVRQAEEFYRRGGSTVGALANDTGGHTIDVWFRLTQDSDLGLVSFRGDVTEARKSWRGLLRSSKGVVADVVALLTMQALDLGDAISARLGRLDVVQSTVEMLNDELHENRERARHGLQTLGAIGDAPVMSEIPAAAFERNVKMLEAILQWVEDKCEIVPVSGALQISRGRRRGLSGKLGVSFVDTMLAAWGGGQLLYSDDGFFRGLAAHGYGVPGVWTQQVLQVCREEDKITKEAYEDAVIKLMGMRYRHTWFDADILLTAARQAGWQLKSPFLQVVAETSDENITLESLVSVVADFLFRVESQDVQGITRGAFVDDLLSAVVRRREPQAFAKALKQALSEKFGRSHRVWVTTEEAHIDAWLRTRAQLRRR